MEKNTNDKQKCFSKLNKRVERHIVVCKKKHCMNKNPHEIETVNVNKG